jgi:hypothetical protein
MSKKRYEKVRQDFVELCVSCVPEKQQSDRAKSASREFDDLCGDERVRHVAVNDRTLYVGTFPLIFRSSDQIPRGPFEFIISVLTSNKAIHCENLAGITADPLNEHRKGQHPHVFSGGSPCLADGIEKIRLWFADGKLGHIALYMLSFLEMARGASDYVSPDAWPVMSDEEVEQCLKLRRSGMI